MSVILILLINLMNDRGSNSTDIYGIDSNILDMDDKIHSQTLDKSNYGTDKNIQRTKRDIEKSTEAKGT